MTPAFLAFAALVLVFILISGGKTYPAWPWYGAFPCEVLRVDIDHVTLWKGERMMPSKFGNVKKIGVFRYNHKGQKTEEGLQTIKFEDHGLPTAWFCIVLSDSRAVFCQKNELIDLLVKFQVRGCIDSEETEAIIAKLTPKAEAA